MRTWRSFVYVLVGGFAFAILALAGFVLLMNPYGNLPQIVFSEHAITDTNQRFQYPALIRSKRYDSIVIGASDSRLMHPRALERVFGGRFANLALNAGRAYEQYRVAMLFIDEVQDRHTLVVGLDRAWCHEEADKERFTSRAFPEWMYDSNRWNDFRYMLNTRTVEISGRRLGQALQFRSARYVDGYEVFTPPESQYDLQKVKFKLWKEPNPDASEPVTSPYAASAEERVSWQYPALPWLDEIAGRFAGRVVFVFVPAHISAQPRPGSAKAARLEECKARIETIARRHNAPFLDFNIESELTANDSNWWDPLHYRLPIADRVVDGIERALATGKDDPNGDWRYREGPRGEALSATAR